MAAQSVFELLEGLRLAEIMRAETPSTEWVFVTVETLHVMALTLVFGTIAMVDIRLLGWTRNKSPIGNLARELLPWTWTAWLMAAITGTLMFISKATIYASNLDFQLKFVCMGLAAVNMLVFHFGPYKTVASWGGDRTPPLSARAAGATSLVLWVGVVVFGRWIGFTS
jgi:hypothetical protein